MNRIKKKITVRFFKIDSTGPFIEDLSAILRANLQNNNSVRITNIRDKKYLFKIHDEMRKGKIEIFFLSIVRERITWQTRAMRDGSISEIPLNQGLIGDPYYFAIVPDDKLILGFTTGPSGSLKSVASTALAQFRRDRTSNISLEYYLTNEQFNKLSDLHNFSSLHFKINTTLLSGPTEETPSLLRAMCDAPFLLSNSLVALTIRDISKAGFSEQDIIDIVDYLYENDGCNALAIEGKDRLGNKKRLDLSKAYHHYQTQIDLRTKFISEDTAKSILLEALNSFDISKTTNPVSPSL